MKTNQLEDALSDCLELMRAGVPLNDCLARYPALAGDLRERLTVALAFEGARLAPLDPGAQARGRAKLISAVAQVDADGAATWRAAGPLALAGGALRRFVAVPYALPAVLAMLILGGAAWGVSAATGNANPGDWLAGSASDDEREEYRGTIIAIGADSVTITTTTAGDVTALITPDTEFEDLDDRPLSPAEFALGDVVKLSAFRGPDGELIAREIEREADALDDDDQSPDDDDDDQGPGNTNDDDEADDDGSGPGPNSGPSDDDADDDASGPGPNSGPSDDDADDDGLGEDDDDDGADDD